jgi:DNA-binding beta-propeller fold protein YncE
MTHGESINATELNVGDPKELAIDPRVDADGWGPVLGINPFQDAIVVIDPWRGGVRNFARVPKPAGLAIHPEGHTVYASSKTRGNLYSFHSRRPGSIDRMPMRETHVGMQLGGVAVSGDGRFVVTVSKKAGIATIHDPLFLSVVRTLETDRKPEDLVIVESEGGVQTLLVSCRGRGRKGGSVQAFDLLTGDLVARFGGLRKPGRIAARGTRAWVVQQGARTITAIDVGHDGVPVLGKSVPGGKRPIDVTISPVQPHILFAVNKGRSMLSVVNSESGQILTTLKAKGAIAVATWMED